MKIEMKATLLLCLLLSATPACAELYKWVDEQGNVHYSDSKPAGHGGDTLRAKPGKDEVKDRYGTYYAHVDSPLRNSAGAARSVRLAGVEFNLHPDMRGGYLGAVRGGKLCKSVQDNFTLGRRNRSQVANSLRIHFDQAVKRLGYTLFEGEDDTSWLTFLSNNPKPDYRLYASVELIQANGCNKKYIAVYKTDMSTYYRVKWTLVDTDSGNIAYQGTTSGYHSSLYYTKELRKKGFPDSSEKSIRHVIDNLFAQQLFVSKLAK